MTQDTHKTNINTNYEHTGFLAAVGAYPVFARMAGIFFQKLLCV